MADLGIHPAQQLTKTLEARFRNRKTMASGLIEVVINSNWNSGDGPFIEFDETIKGFGIYYQRFKPGWLKMSYNAELKQLTVPDLNGAYEFTLDFK